MRLNRFNPGNIRVRRGGGGGFPGGGGGKIGCGGLLVVIVAALVFGVDPAQMLGSMEEMQQGSPGQPYGNGGGSVADICNDNQYSYEACSALASLDETWEPVFRAAGIPFEQPELVFYQGGTRSGCGAAQSAMGPFYCPADHGIYIDTSFYDQMARQMGAPGDFARYYVIAHEYGHHIQTLTGISRQIRQLQQQKPQQANSLQVAMELQADCYAGVWAGKNRDRIEPGDLEEGMGAAHAIGDDTLMRNAGRAVVAESFTHGSSAQRMQALRLGLETGDDTQCDRIIG
ncbi:Putative neutral zinc metallopeptidase [Croceibacterium atlanticum]|uniref:Neutral zinc metallopeptidase n=1 Tax=Croceibacterium atlanticum TaxID=1267766 RepID=A0A0F7KP26_9SPHN|nr:neutral zinc metallopeptidase [Croceibacterium atlanticum]AKH41339.1 Putative neutral zinc metallopeptidase [Croceibacterium atlanticum]